MNDDAASALPTQSPPRSAPTVLIADASRDTRQCLARLAATTLPGAAIIQAASGREAYERLTSGAAGIAFLDMDFPDMGGADALAAARAAGAHPLAILMAQHLDAAREIRARQVDAYELLAKPVDGEKIRQALSNHARMNEPCRVLVADDSKAFRHIIRKVFAASRFSIDCDVVDNGEIAIGLLRRRDYDVIFIDYEMPGLDGIEIASLVQDASPATRAVMVSATADTPVERAARHFGAVDFLKKPFFTAEVDRALHVALDLPLPSLLLARPACADELPAVRAG
jgi:CheY-like chemotaxis protein